MSSIEVKVPDIGDYKNVPVIEVHVKPGQEVKAEDPLITLESDKAAMDVPAPQGGTVESVLVKPGDKVSQGSIIIKLADGANAAAPSTVPAAPAKPTAETAPVQPQPSPSAPELAADVPESKPLLEVPPPSPA